MQVLGNASISACLTRRALLATRAATSVAARLPLFAMHQTTIACFARRMAASLGRVYARAPASISLEAHLPARRRCKVRDDGLFGHLLAVICIARASLGLVAMQVLGNASVSACLTR